MFIGSWRVLFFYIRNSRVFRHTHAYLIYNSSICSSVPSILRNSRYRRDQRQLEEEEEIWFSEEDDFEDGEAVVPATNDLLGKKLDSDLDSIGKFQENSGRINLNIMDVQLRKKIFREHTIYFF